VLEKNDVVTRLFMPDGEKIRFTVKEDPNFVDACWLLRRDVIGVVSEIYSSIGTCDSCFYSYIHGSNLVCGFMNGPLEADGFCNHYKQREIKE